MKRQYFENPGFFNVDGKWVKIKRFFKCRHTVYE